MKHPTTSAPALGLARGVNGATTDCGLEAGAVRIRSDDVPALHAVVDVARALPGMAGNPDLAAWLIKGFHRGPAWAGVIASTPGGAEACPMVPQRGVPHGAPGAELADLLAGSETVEQALADVAYGTAVRAQGFLH